MALNLWTLAGKSTGYSPLPTGLVNFASVGIGEYIVVFKAKSIKLGTLRVLALGVSSVDTVLSADFKEYTIQVSRNSYGGIYLEDKNSAGDITIKDISVTEKPLGAATINGIDGFASGKWSLHANAKVIDDETLELNATELSTTSYISIPVQVGTYYLNLEHTGLLRLYKGNVIPNSGTTVYQSTAGIVNVDSSFNGYLTIRFTNAGIGKFTFKRPQLNLGSTPAPYSKKTGTRMVKPEARKNLFDEKAWTTRAVVDGKDVLRFNGYIIPGSGIVSGTPLIIARDLKPNTNYTVRGKFKRTTYWNNLIAFYSDNTSAQITRFAENFSESLITFNTGSKPIKSLFIDTGAVNADGYAEVNTIQIEEGTTATPYEPYAVQQNAKPRKAVQAAPKGLAFDGVRDNMRLHGITMDAIEMDAFLDNVQPQGVSAVLFQRILPTSYYGRIDPSLSSNNFISVSPSGIIPKGQRLKIKYTFPAWGGDTTIFSNISGAFPIKGTLYGVKCYLAGQLVAAYDFTQPGAVIGDKVVPAPQNLIPPFDDKRWSLHANFRVLGRDVGRLDANLTYLESVLVVPVKPNTAYRLYLTAEPNSRIRVGKNDGIGSGSYIGEISTQGFINFTTDATTKEVRMVMQNLAYTGTYHFIKPQLYELPATAGTLYGAPRVNDKPARRTLYAKR